MRGLAAAALGAMALLGVGGVARAAASPGSAGTAIVSLGDSFISGEGGRWLGNGSEPLGTRSGSDRAAYGCDALGLCEYDPTRVYGASEENDCHRSDVAPIRSAPVVVADKANLACSGATLANVWPAASGGRPHFGEAPQADQLAPLAAHENVRMVVLTAGANDVGFGELVAGCALEWARSPEEDPSFCRGHAQDEVDAALPVMEQGLEKALRGLRATMATAGYRRSDYRLVTMGYASPFPSGRWFRYPEGGWSRLNEGGCPVWNADADWAADRATVDLAEALESAAAATGAEYLDLADAFEGHQLCDRRSERSGSDGPSPLTAEWFRRLSFTQGSTRESLHPNAYGQRVMGTCLGLFFDRPRGNYACADAPGEWLAGIHLRAVVR